jgi:nucleotide-binding universal stress UspA family protein
MYIMNKLLIPVDFSATSLNALIYATKLFAGSDLEITLLHTYDVSSSAAFRMKSIDRFMEDDAEREMEALVRKMEKEAPDIALKTKIVKREAIPTITSLGDTGTYDLIVMGTKGASGLKEVFMGSVAGGVISKTEAPVLVVPAGYTYQPLREIAFAISDMPFSEDSVVAPLRKLAKMHAAKVNVLHVSDDQESDLSEVMKSIDDLNPSLTYAFGTGDINQHLQDYLREEDAGLLCLVRRNKGFFNRLFGGSVTLQQTFSSSVPLLILHD